MIPKKLIRAYLNEPKDNWLWLKEKSEAEIDDMLKQLRPRPRFVANLWLHQKVCFLLGVAMPQFCFWLGMAGGKTVLSLELLNYWRMCGKVETGLAMSLDPERLYNWEKDIKDIGYDLPHLMLDTGSSKENWSLLAENKPALVLAPYPTVAAMLSELEKVKNKAKTARKPKPKLATQFAQYVDAVFWDESTKAGNLSSVVNRTCRLLSNRIDYRYGLAGVPFGRDPVLLRNQTNLVDHGKTFGPNLEMFYAAYFSEKENHWAKGNRAKYAKSYTFLKTMKEDLAVQLQHRSITYTTDELKKLRTTALEVRKQNFYVSFGEDAQSYFDKFMARMKKAAKVGDIAARDNSFIRMRQIASGFIGVKDDETGDRAEVEFPDNPKLDMVLELVARIPPKRKFLIVYEYNYTGRKIVEALRAQGIRGGWLWSGTKDPLKVQHKFDTDPDYRFIVGNWRKTAFGLNAQKGNYTIVVERPVSVIESAQVDLRQDRPGQTRIVRIWDIVMRPIDEKIQLFHKEGGSLFKSLMRDPSKKTLKPKR